MKSEAKTKWYSPETMKPVWEMPLKDGSGMTATTVVHARKHGFLPSVTSIDDSWNEEGLTRWKITQAIKYTTTFPFDQEVTPENVSKYAAMIVAKAKEYLDALGERGKSIHKDVDEFLTNKVEAVDPVGLAAATAIGKFLFEEHGITEVYCEHPLGSVELGYAGTPDIYALGPGKVMIVDTKTTEVYDPLTGKKKYKSPYPSQRLQLGAYRKLLGSEAELWNAVVDRNTGQVLFIELEDPERWEAAFSALLEAWFLVHNHDPRRTNA
jgi:hypothetical protein